MPWQEATARSLRVESVRRVAPTHPAAPADDARAAYPDHPARAEAAASRRPACSTYPDRSPSSSARHVLLWGQRRRTL
jgi:hypothetical protein